MALRRICTDEPRDPALIEQVECVLRMLEEPAPDLAAATGAGDRNPTRAGSAQLVSADIPPIDGWPPPPADPIGDVRDLSGLARWMWQMQVQPSARPRVSEADLIQLWNQYGQYAGPGHRPMPQRSAFDPQAGIPSDPAFRQALSFDIAGPTYWDYGLSNLLTVPGTWKAAQESDDIAQKPGVAGILPSTRGGNAQDAFRHFAASCLTASRYGNDVAKMAGDTHERTKPGPPGDNAMDLWNNYQGRLAAVGVTGNALGYCTQSALDRFRAGQLMLEPFRSNDPMDTYLWRRPLWTDPQP